MANDEERQIAALLMRVQKLQRILNQDEANIGSPPQVTLTLAKVIEQLRDALAQRNSINTLFTRISSLEELIDPGSGSALTQTSASKLELVTCMEQMMSQTAADLEDLKKQQSLCNSNQIKALALLEPKIKKLSKTFMDIKVASDKQVAQIEELADKYNATMVEVTNRLDVLDKTLSKYEASCKKQVKT